MTFKRHSTGQHGEKIAQSLLKRKGFQIQACNWRLGQIGEIDIIAYHPDHNILAFIEVKTRKNSQYGSPSEAVSRTKQAQLIVLAEAYLSLHPSMTTNMRCRFDVIGIFFPGQNQPADIQHIEDAFAVFS